MKPSAIEGKLLNLDQSNISQMIESVDECRDFYMHDQLMPNSNYQMKSYHLGGVSLLSQF
jgi:hypothetical protein